MSHPSSLTPFSVLPALRSAHIKIFLLCISIACAMGFLFLVSNGVWGDAQPMLVLILAVVLGIVSFWPAVAAMRLDGRWDIFQPLFYSSWFFFLPQFVAASLVIVLGKLETFVALALPEPWTPRAAALGLAILGSAGLSLGYFLPLGRWLGRGLPQFKEFEIPPNELKPAALLFLGIGELAGMASFYSGNAGYQFNLETSTFGATFAAFASFALLGHGIIWFSFFRNPRGWRFLAFLSIGLQIVGVVISGARGALLGMVLFLLVSYQYAHGSLPVRKLVRWIPVLLGGLFVGMVFGTSFRETKVHLMGRISMMSAGDLLTISQLTFHAVWGRPLSQLLLDGWISLLQRFDGITSLAVILAKAGQLKGAEVAMGIDHNIFKDLASSLIPRFLWKAKPIVGINEQMGFLYFNTRYNSPAVTYMGDLFRNFGVWGVLGGMLLLGVVLRAIYVWLMEKRARTPLRVVLFLLFSFTVNYEALYSTYFPGLIRIVAMGLLAVFLAKVLRVFQARG